MNRQELELTLKRAADMVEEAGLMANRLLDASPGTYDDVMKLVDPVVDRLEEAHQVLLEAEPEDLPEQQPPGEGADAEDGSPEDAIPDDALDGAMRRQELEHRARIVEAKAYRLAADLVGPRLKDPGAATEEQSSLLGEAATALEAAFGSRQDVSTLLELAEVRILQCEVKRARQVLDVAMKLDPDGPGGERARVLLSSLDEKGAPRDKGRCFIATAACGSPDAPEVRSLRRLRDEVLVLMPAGRLLIRVYQATSPRAARMIETRPAARHVVRTLLVRPAARLAERWMELCGATP
ncbi:MAG: hypothetical protein FJ109_12400 [Deltaproteobacteria bacterium]|nr:hypothetical protein [Deltaproteobacteria bacterium]